jgi:hypothetical protein
MIALVAISGQASAGVTISDKRYWPRETDFRRRGWQVFMTGPDPGSLINSAADY